MGDGEEAESLKNHASQLKSKEQISFLGFRKDRLELMASFDLFVMTSSLEGVPRCLMECMAMGIPVAAYNIAGVDQLIEDGKTGMCVAFGDKEGLKEKWDFLLRDRHLAAKLAENARQKVNAEFSGARMAKEYTELFKGLIEKN